MKNAFMMKKPLIYEYIKKALGCLIIALSMLVGINLLTTEKVEAGSLSYSSQTGFSSCSFDANNNMICTIDSNSVSSFTYPTFLA